MSKVKAKNFGYESKKQEEPKINKKSTYIAIAVLGVLVLTVIILLCVEKSMENKIVAKNKSSHNITKLHFWYEDAENKVTDIMDFGAVASKETRTESTADQNLSELQGEASLMVQMEFEDGGKAVLETGQFLYDFKGKISFEIADTDEEDLIIRLKAGEGLFNSTTITGCDDVYYINPKDGYIE